MKRVLITGASGFIGRHAVPLMIESGFEVHAVFHTTQPSIMHKPQLFWHQCNLLNPNEQKCLLTQVRPTYLLHFAWYSTPGKYWTSLENLRWVQASLELLINFVELGGKRAVLAGSCAEYDWNHGYCLESLTPTQPATLYGTCKSSLRSMLEGFSKQTGLSSAWGRIFFLYGPYEHPSRLIASVIRSLLKEEPAAISHGNQIRDFLHVEDVASAFISLLKSEVQGPVNIASGQPVVLKEIAELIAEKIKRRELLKIGAIPSPESDPPLLLANTMRLEKEVGWKPKYNLDTGLEQTIQWWRVSSKLDEKNV